MKNNFIALVLTISLISSTTFIPNPILANSMSAIDILDLDRQEELQENRYELWFIAVNENVSSSAPDYLKNQILKGHVFIALMKREENNSYSIRQTWGFWGNEGNNGLVIGSDRDKDIVRKLVDNKINNINFGVVISRVTNSRADWIENTAPESAGCNNDEYVAIGGVGTSCNCIDFATRSFHSFTAHQEDFRVGYLVNQEGLLTGYSPEGIIKAIHKRNEEQGHRYVDDGNIWS